MFEFIDDAGQMWIVTNEHMCIHKWTTPYGRAGHGYKLSDKEYGELKKSYVKEVAI